MSRVRRWAPVAYPVLLVVLTAVQQVVPQRSGPLAVTQVFAPWLFVPLLFLLPFALALRDRVLAGALTLAVLAFGAHVGPGWSPSRETAAPGSVPVRVVSWNVLLSNRTADVRDTVWGFDADVVGLVELTPRQAARLRAEPPAYRTALLHPEVGRALYSRYPVVDSGVVADPAGRPGSALLWARLDLGAGRELTAIVAHPLPAEASLPALRYDAGPRDAEIAFVRAFTDRQVAAGRRVVLMGDFNVTDREPGGRELARGLSDAHDAGWGPDPSWGPLFLREHGIAVVRIDRILGGPGVVPTSFRTDCAFHGSDHCVLAATVAVAQ